MKRVILICIAIVLLGAIAFGIWYFSCANNRYFSKYEPQTQGELKVGAINVCGFKYMVNMEVIQAVLLEAARTNDLDVLLLQEFPVYPADLDEKVLSYFYDFFPYISKIGECAVFSRLPIIDHQRVPYFGQQESYSSILIGPEENPFKIIALHLRTTGLSSVDNGRSLSTVGDVINIKTVLSSNNSIRVEQAKNIYDEIEATPIPLIVAGDFNSLPYSKVYRILKGDVLQDSFIEAGKGKGSTYRLLKDQIRIDYILHNDGFQCVGAEVSDEQLSDHRLIISTFNWQ